jgi:hypothetical protein
VLMLAAAAVVLGRKPLIGLRAEAMTVSARSNLRLDHYHAARPWMAIGQPEEWHQLPLALHTAAAHHKHPS